MVNISNPNLTTKEVLQEARDFLAAGHWTTGIGDVDHETKEGATCLIGALAFVLKPTHDIWNTTSAIETIIRLDGKEAVKALYNALPKALQETRKPSDDRWSLLYHFNDDSDLETVLALYDKAIASLV